MGVLSISLARSCGRGMLVPVSPFQPNVMSERVRSELQVRADFEEQRGCAGQAAALRDHIDQYTDEYVMWLLESFDQQTLEMHEVLGTEPDEPWLRGRTPAYRSQSEAA